MIARSEVTVQKKIKRDHEALSGNEVLSNRASSSRNDLKSSVAPANALWRRFIFDVCSATCEEIIPLNYDNVSVPGYQARRTYCNSTVTR